jgi:site-specific DNA-cytosine methylase
MKIIIGCEFSQIVTKAFRAKGHEAYSCDVISAEGGHPEWHLQGNIFYYLDNVWDLLIAHPPCTHLCVSGARWFKNKQKEQEFAIGFFMDLINSKTLKIAIENPIGIMSTRYRKPDQIIQPWMFGHGETKATCLWLKGLPKLKPTKIVEGREQRIHKLPPSKDRGKLRSITYQGIAEAMADQWG